MGFTMFYSTETLTKHHIYYEITTYEKQNIGEKLQQHENLSTPVQNILYIAYLSVTNHSEPKSLGGSWDCECSPKKHNEWQRYR